jgi:hypothetical protein
MGPWMLFFFELFLFVLVLVTLALGEFVSRGLALGLWLVATALVVGGYFLARGALAPVLAGAAGDGGVAATPTEMSEGHTEALATRTEGASSDAPTPLDARWARTLLYNWRRANVLLVLGLLAVGGWYWLGA